MSDVGILNDPVSIIAIILLLGSPGFLLAIPGALLWRLRRVVSALVGAGVGFAIGLTGWLVFNDVI
jgi:hypothetical protein